MHPNINVKKLSRKELEKLAIDLLNENWALGAIIEEAVEDHEDCDCLGCRWLEMTREVEQVENAVTNVAPCTDVETLATRCPHFLGEDCPFCSQS